MNVRQLVSILVNFKMHFLEFIIFRVMTYENPEKLLISSNCRSFNLKSDRLVYFTDRLITLILIRGYCLFIIFTNHFHTLEITNSIPGYTHKL